MPHKTTDAAPFFEIACDATFEDVRMILRQVDMRLKSRAVGEENRGSVQLVLAEAMNNIVEHAFSDNAPDNGFQLRIDTNDTGLNVTLTDQGDAMPWSEVRNPGILRRPMTPEYAKEGGFGWSIIKALTAEVDYARDRNTNRLTFRIDAPQVAAPAPGARRRDARLFARPERPEQ